MSFEDILALGICGVILLCVFFWIVYRIPRQFRSRGWLFGIILLGIWSILFLFEQSISTNMRLAGAIIISSLILYLCYLLLAHQYWNPLTIIHENYLYQDEEPEVWGTITPLPEENIQSGGNQP